MGKNGSFQVDRKFFDDEHFPYGFARSGNFAIEQANLLEAHGCAYIEFASGQRKPAGSLVTSGNTGEPSSISG